MPILPFCPQCSLEDTYQDGDHYICPHCAHEWPMIAPDTYETDDAVSVKDCNNNPLIAGDAVILIKDLKVKGSSITLKKGTKIKGIRLVAGDHEVDCKINGSSFMLKASFLKKA